MTIKSIIKKITVIALLSFAVICCACASDNTQKTGEGILCREGIVFSSSVDLLEIGKSFDFEAKAFNEYKDVGDLGEFVWSVSEMDGRASVEAESGRLTAHTAGSVTVRVEYRYNELEYSAEREVVLYRPAVILIHGRSDNSFNVWGANSRVMADPTNSRGPDNDHYDSDLNASILGKEGALYIDPEVQKLVSYDCNGIHTVPAVFNGVYVGENTIHYIDSHPEGGNLAYYLTEMGYTPNVDLFVFNYPNQDAVIHNANKLDKYLDALAEQIRKHGSPREKASFFGRVEEIGDGCSYSIDMVGHSMGGLVARYYIENVGKDENVRRLISVGTPHWGSGLANAACITGALHSLCDHDLRTGSLMYGGNLGAELKCRAISGKCCEKPYTVSDELKYSAERRTEYYAIASIDYDSDGLCENDFAFEISTEFSSVDDIYSELQKAAGNCLYKTVSGTELPINIGNEGDNVVGFLSQIGCSEGNGGSLEKIVRFEKIFVDIDTDGGNSVVDHLHSKIPHREIVMEKIFDFLTQ